VNPQSKSTQKNSCLHHDDSCEVLFHALVESKIS